ncbi:MAG TPA: ABC transporter ATP-binding protein [Clostridia bacterium]|nr:ABC transporter ATP-binding protein [Clostridia bacterium]
MTICAMRQVVKRYQEVVALNHFDLEVKEGEILGLLGPNGSGKTTSINCILGLLTYDEGDITVFERTLGPDDNDLKRRIGFVPSDLSYFDELSVIDNLNYFAGLYASDKFERKRMVEYAVEFTGLEKYRKFAAKKLSGGLKRRLNIACGIAHKPDFLILDEPTLALDAQSRKFVLEGIREMNRLGSTVLYTTHYLEEAQELCDRIVIIDQGRNLATGTLDELINLVDPTESVHIEFIEAKKDTYDMIRALDGVVDVAETNGKAIIRLSPPGHHLAALLDALRDHEVAYTSIYSELPSLNDVFLTLTGKALRE